MSNAHFAKVPNINIPRSTFPISTNTLTTMNHGQLIPIRWFSVLPGDTFNLKVSTLIRMSAPIFPIMDNITAYIHAFFVPMRLVWSHTKEFFGENLESSGYETQEFELPGGSLIYGYGEDISNLTHPDSLAAYLGYQFNLDAISDDINGNQCVLLSRCYHLIWSEWYRAQQLQDPFILDMGGSGFNNYGYDDGVGSRNGKNFGIVTYDDGVIMPYQVCKKFDYFTAATLAPQYGAAVTLPLGSYAPIVATDQAIHTRNMDIVGIGNNGGITSYIDNGDKMYLKGSGGTNNYQLKADLSEATAATINSIRYAFQVQKYLERSNFGSRFFEMLAVHYGVTSPDARLQRPEYLGGSKFNININQVLSTAGYEAGENNAVGQLGAVSVTGNNSHLFTKGFVEPGYVMIMISTKHDQTYSQGINKELLKKNRFEIYSPEFGNIGDQPILRKELFAESVNGDDVFGYQESWSEYRYMPNQVTGLARPDVKGSINYLSLANNFDAAPMLSERFIVENRDSITRCLTTGEDGPDYLVDMYFSGSMIRELPTYSIPGLVDHFGVM